MTENEILAGLAEIVYDVTGVATDRVVPSATFNDDLDIDSLSMVEVIVAAEERFGVRIPDGDAEKLKTVADAVAYIRNAGVPA